MPVFLTGLAKLELFYLLQGEQCENVIHVTKGSAWGSTDLSTLVSTAITWAGTTAAKQVRTSASSFVGAKASDLSAAGGPIVSGVASIAGTAGPNALPNNCTVAIKLNTGLGGRSNHGRYFHIGLERDMVSNNRIVSPYDTNIPAALSALITAIEAISDWLVVVASFVTAGAPRPTAVANQVTGLSMDLVVDSQRRRLPEHNRHR